MVTETDAKYLNLYVI